MKNKSEEQNQNMTDINKKLSRKNFLKTASAAGFMAATGCKGDFNFKEFFQKNYKTLNDAEKKTPPPGYRRHKKKLQSRHLPSVREFSRAMNVIPA